jgi:hypothetical protein
MAKFKQLTIHGTSDKVIINLDRVLFIRPYDRYAGVYFTDRHSITVAESVNDILQAKTLPNA